MVPHFIILNTPLQQCSEVAHRSNCELVKTPYTLPPKGSLSWVFWRKLCYNGTTMYTVFLTCRAAVPEWSAGDDPEVLPQRRSRASGHDLQYRRWHIHSELTHGMSLSPLHSNGNLHIEGLVQERRNFFANTLELPLSCTNPSHQTDVTPWH